MARSYRRRSDALGQGESLGIAVECDAEGIAVPLEWAVIDGLNVPLCRKVPVRRELVGVARKATTVRQLLDDTKATPLRVLIVGANTGGLAQVPEEIQAVRTRFEALFRQVGWPITNVTVLSGTDATTDLIKTCIEAGSYHILHFAGHGTHREDLSGLAAFKSVPKGEVDVISATSLRDWIAGSEVRFVYLGSCSVPRGR